MLYSDILKELDKTSIDYKHNINLEIALCVNCSLPVKAHEKTFNALCNYVQEIWYKVDQAYTQLIADVVVDCYYKCYEYTPTITLTMNDLLTLNKIDDVTQAYLDKYYE